MHEPGFGGIGVGSENTEKKLSMNVLLGKAFFIDEDFVH